MHRKMQLEKMEHGTCYIMVKKIKGTYLGHYKYDVCLNDYGV